MQIKSPSMRGFELKSFCTKAIVLSIDIRKILIRIEDHICYLTGSGNMECPFWSALPYFNGKGQSLLFSIRFFDYNNHRHHHLVKILDGNGCTGLRLIVLVGHTLHSLVEFPVVHHPLSPEPGQVFAT